MAKSKATVTITRTKVTTRTKAASSTKSTGHKGQSRCPTCGRYK